MMHYVLDGKRGFINKQGHEVIGLLFDDMKSFSEGMAAVGERGTYYIKWGCINRKGIVVVPCAPRMGSSDTGLWITREMRFYRSYTTR